MKQNDKAHKNPTWAQETYSTQVQNAWIQPKAKWITTISKWSKVCPKTERLGDWDQIIKPFLCETRHHKQHCCSNIADSIKILNHPYHLHNVKLVSCTTGHCFKSMFINAKQCFQLLEWSTSTVLPNSWKINANKEGICPLYTHHCPTVQH